MLKMNLYLDTFIKTYFMSWSLVWNCGFLMSLIKNVLHTSKQFSFTTEDICSIFVEIHTYLEKICQSTLFFNINRASVTMVHGLLHTAVPVVYIIIMAGCCPMFFCFSWPPLLLYNRRFYATPIITVLWIFFNWLLDYI